MADYVVSTDLPPEAISRIGMEIFKAWMDFALGETTLGGRRIAYPTGRYAASIQYRQLGVAEVAIVADASIAPEAAILETGHGAVDLKVKLAHGRAYPMHRFRGGGPGGLRRIGSGQPPGFRAAIWASHRGAESSGFASIGANSPAESWIIPPMAAYSPALVLSQMARKMAQEK